MVYSLFKPTISLWCDPPLCPQVVWIVFPEFLDIKIVFTLQVFAILLPVYESLFVVATQELASYGLEIGGMCVVEMVEQGTLCSELKRTAMRTSRGFEHVHALEVLPQSLVRLVGK